jgi:hypothetical protein
LGVNGDFFLLGFGEFIGNEPLNLGEIFLSWFLVVSVGFLDFQFLRGLRDIDFGVSALFYFKINGELRILVNLKPLLWNSVGG